MSRYVLTVPLAAIVVLAATAAHAQTVGTFRWQTGPYCNLIALTVIQQGTAFQLTGADDRCGAGVAPVSGTAILTGASVALGFAVTSPSGATSHVSATVSLATLSGTWTDSDARTGPFVFSTGTSTGGSPRPEVDARRPTAGFSDSTALITITNPTVVGQLSIAAPVPGTIVASGVGTNFLGTAGESSCSLSTTGLWDGAYAQYSQSNVAAIAVIRHFAVPAGIFNVTMVCDTNGPGTGSIARPKLSAVFIPN